MFTHYVYSHLHSELVDSVLLFAAAATTITTLAKDEGNIFKSFCLFVCLSVYLSACLFVSPLNYRERSELILVSKCVNVFHTCLSVT